MTLVLLVDDDVNLLKALAALVSDCGYAVQTAANGEVALLKGGGATT